MSGGKALLWGVFAATLAATGWTAYTEATDREAGGSARTGPAPYARVALAAPAVPAPPAAADAAMPAATPEPAGATIEAAAARPAPDRPAVNLFPAYSWQPPPPPPAPPARPAPPPLPFTFAGRLIDQDSTAYLLAEGVRIHEVVVGGEVGDYTLESASAEQLSFLHRPTGEHLPLALPQ